MLLAKLATAQNTNCNITVALTENPGDSICSGTQDTIRISGGHSYLWSNPVSTDSVIIVAPTTTTTYNVQVTKGTCILDTFIVIAVGTSLQVTILPQSDTVCAEQGITLSVPAVSGTIYVWSPSVGLNATVGDSVVAAPTITTVYTESGISDGCPSSGTDTVFVKTAPDKPKTTINGDSVVFSSNATKDNKWFYNDTLISTGETATVPIVSTCECAWITLIDSATGCSITDTVYIEGINQLSATNNQISIYPNPTSNQLTITSNQLSIQKIEIDNVLGETMLIYAPQFNKAGTAVNLDVSHLADGMYFVRITSNNEMITRKVIVSR
jgi:hypothetical protein